jgi:ankyrin repeat protein
MPAFIQKRIFQGHFIMSSLKPFDPAARLPSPEEVEGFCTAAQRGDIAFVRDMLDQFAGGIVNARDNINARAITWAAFSGHTEVVELLLQRGADIDAGGTENKPALTWAISGNHHETAAALLSRGASLEVKDDNGRTPVDYAEHNPGMMAMIEDRRAELAEHERLHGVAAQEAAARAAAASRLEQLKKGAPGKFKLPGSHKP